MADAQDSYRRAAKRIWEDPGWVIVPENAQVILTEDGAMVEGLLVVKQEWLLEEAGSKE